MSVFFLKNIGLNCLFITGLFCSVNNACAETAGKTDTLFLSDKIIRMELRTDFTAIQAERAGVVNEHDGILICRSGGSRKLTLSVKVSARGNFRLNPENCSFPPLLINFKKGEVENTVFENQNKLKLITPCQTEEDVIDEYTIYKMYNEVTDISFKVRLVRIRYFDTSLDEELFTRYSFFIEDKDHVAERNDLVAKKIDSMTFVLNRKNYLNLAVFQYIIGNKDWFAPLQKNVEIMESDSPVSELFAVPYDFDFSAFVNAEYTKITVEHEDVMKDRRLYLGPCTNEAEFKETFEYFKSIKPVFRSIIKKQGIIAGSDRSGILDYVESFYELIEDQGIVQKEFIEMCYEY